MEKMGTVAIYAKDVSDQKFKEYYSWVAEQGFTDIMDIGYTPVRGRSGDKELRQMMQDVKEGKIRIVFISSLLDSGLIGVSPMNLLLVIAILKSFGTRLNSREEPWTDMSAVDFMFLCI